MKTWIFRLVACGVPTVIGLAAIFFLLLEQERLVVDPVNRTVALQSAPIYIQEQGHELTGHRYLYDQLLGWRNIPSWSATTNGKQLTINSQGLRDRETTLAKPPGVRRILVLGDSFVWGYGVGDDETFPAVMESRLADQTPPWEVLNTGVSGWGTDQEYLFFINEGINYQPDLVVVALFLVNDPNNNVFGRQYGIAKPVYLNSELKLGNVPVPLPGSQSPPVTSTASPIGLTAAILEALRQRCTEIDAPLVVMSFGRFLAADDKDLARDAQLLAQVLQKQSPEIHYLELDSEYTAREISKQQLTEGNDDGHWNAQGHQVTAEILLEYLQEQGLLTETADEEQGASES